VNVSNGNAPENVEGSRYSTTSFNNYLPQPDIGGWHGRFGINTTRNTGFYFNGWTRIKQEPLSAGQGVWCVFNDEAAQSAFCSSARYLVIWAR
jgi:hypothetical protein